MKVILQILRTRKGGGPQWLQSVPYEGTDENATVATALSDINSKADYRDTEGNTVSPVLWECSCLQKKCGACAMRINGKPRLACDTKLREFKKGRILLEPLKKFPVIEDLVVDRSILQENLKKIRVWLPETARIPEERYDMAYEASRCLQCGCCLEVCPNFYAGGDFAGTAGFVPTAKLLSELSDDRRQEIRKAYRKYFYEGCGKSLACRNICPAGIDVDHLLVNSNAMAIWKRR